MARKKRFPTLIDCDPGVDDALALALAMASPELDLRAITTVHGNVPVGELLLDRDAAPSDDMELFVFGNEGGWNARLVARLDNLGKGASGNAVQCLNLMLGLDGRTGLSS